MHSSSSEQILVTLLGTGVPSPNVNRRGASQIVALDGDTVLVDCGAGTLYRLLESKADVRTITHVCLTHLHSDHITGLPDFLWAGWVGRWWEEPPTIIGPIGTAQFIQRLLHAFEEDISLRTSEGANTREGISCEVIEVTDGWSLKHKRWDMVAIEVEHKPVEFALGFLFRLAERKIVISGDTRRCENLIRYSKDADILVHEVIWGEGMRKAIAQAEMPQRARLERILSYHTPSLEVGKIAALANVRHLVLSHLVFAGGTPDDLISDVRQSFQGRISVGEDLAVYAT